MKGMNYMSNREGVLVRGQERNQGPEVDTKKSVNQTAQRSAAAVEGGGWGVSQVPSLLDKT